MEKELDRFGDFETRWRVAGILRDIAGQLESGNAVNPNYSRIALNVPVDENSSEASPTQLVVLTYCVTSMLKTKNVSTSG